MTKYFYEETGMYIDWKQLDKLPNIDTLIDIGVGPSGTPDLYQRFNTQKLILIDPLSESEIFVKENLNHSNFSFYKTALGAQKSELIINVEAELGRSSLLNVSDINYEGAPIEKRNIKVDKLDTVLSVEKNLGKIGIKIDTEGYELNVILGASKCLQSTKFVLAEVRHNHESFDGVYKMHEFISAMTDNGFVLTMILTAKPFIADLCFQPKLDL